MTDSITTTQALGAATIERAEITDVYPESYTVDAVAIASQRLFLDIPFATPFCNPEHGGGYHMIPEVGAVCYVVTAADGSQFILGFALEEVTTGGLTYDLEGRVTGDAAATQSRKGFRPTLRPGDTVLATSDGSSVALYKGGVVRIGATGLSQRLYVPVEGIVRDYWNRYEAISPLGEIVWEHAEVHETDGEVKDTAVLVSYSFKESAQEDVTAGRHTVELRYGRLDNQTLDPEKDEEHIFAAEKSVENPDLADDLVGVLSCVIYSHAAEATTYQFQISRDGSVFGAVAGDIHLELGGTVFLSIAEKMRAEFGTSYLQAITATGEFKAYVEMLVLQAVQSLHIEAPILTSNIGNVQVGAAGGALTIQPAGAPPITIGSAGTSFGGTVDVIGSVTAASAAIGGGGNLVVVDKNNLLRAIRSHTHPVAGAVAGTSAELLAVETAVAVKLSAQ